MYYLCEITYRFVGAFNLTQPLNITLPVLEFSFCHLDDRLNYISITIDLVPITACKKFTFLQSSFLVL